MAAIHLGRVPLTNGNSAVNLAVYAQPKGRFGRVYMAAIKPFRLWIVYPQIMRAAAARWRSYLASEQGTD